MSLLYIDFDDRVGWKCLFVYLIININLVMDEKMKLFEGNFNF